MHNRYSIRNRHGATLVELIIAMFISTIVIAGVYQVYRFVTVSTTREKQKAELQRDIITVSTLIERDIRMAGCNLPGNGVTAMLLNEADDRLSLYANENRRETRLTTAAQSVHSSLIVADTAGFMVNGYVCLADTGVDTIFKKITRIGVCNSGSDTLHLSSWLTVGPFPTASTRIFPATRIRYQISGSPAQKMYRIRNAASVPISTLLDSLNIISKNAAGGSVGLASDQAAVIMVLVGGHIGKAGNRVFVGDSTQVNIRN